MKARIVQEFARTTLLPVCMTGSAMAWAVMATVDANDVLSEVPRTLYGTGTAGVANRVSPKDVTEAFRKRPALKPYSCTVVGFRDNH